MSRESLVEALTVLSNRDALVKASKEKFDVLSTIVYKPSLHHVIDSSDSDASPASWSSVAIALCEYLKNTKERTESQKQPTKQLEPIASLLRAVVEAADSKSPSLSNAVSTILTTLTPLLNQHVQEIWLQSCCFGVFGQLLSVPAYWLHIKTPTHLNLIKVYSALLQNYPVSDMAPSNAKIFKLLFSTRLPILSDSSVSLSVSQASDKVSALVQSSIYPLQDFLKRTGTKAMQETVEALNRFLLDAGPSFAQPVLAPIMRQFNYILISRITRPNHHDFFLELVQFFRIQLYLLVSPDGSFDSGIEPDEDDDSSPQPQKGTQRPLPARDWSSPVEKAFLIGEKELFKAVETLVSSCNKPIDVTTPLAVTSSSSVSKKNHYFEYDQYALYQLYCDLLIKQSHQLSTGSGSHFLSTEDSQRSKRSQLEDPRRRLHALIFGNSSGSTLAASTSDPYAQYWESSSSSVLSWLQLTYVMVVEHPHFFDVSWTLKFVWDLWMILDKNSGVFHLDLWMIRLLEAFARATHIMLQQGPRQDAPYGETFSRDTFETPPDDLTDQNQLQQLRSIWTRVWHTLINKLAHLEPQAEDAAVSTLNQLLVDDLVAISTVSATQAALWRLPVIIDATSWEVVPFLTTLLEKHALFPPNKNSELPQETLLNWFDAVSAKAFTVLSFRTENLPEPAQIVRLLRLLIGISPPITSSSVTSSPKSLQNTAVLHAHQNQDFEIALKNLHKARLLLPELDPFSTAPRASIRPSSNVSVNSISHQSMGVVDLFSLGESAKERLTSKLSQILAARFAQTKLDSPLQRRGDRMIPDGLKLVQQMRKQVFHGCLLVGLLNLLSAQHASLRNELETQLRELVELIESNLKMTEDDPSVMSCIFQEASKLILSSQQTPVLYSLFSPLLDISVSYSQTSQLSPASSGIMGSTQASTHPQSSPPSRTTSTSLSQLGPRGSSSSSMEEDLMDFEEEPAMTRQTTELVLSRNSTKSLSTVVFSAKLTNRLQCYFQAAWMTASVYKVLPTEHRNFSVATKALLSAISGLAASSPSNAPMLLQLLSVLLSRAEYIRSDQLDVVADIIARFIPLVLIPGDFQLLMDSLVRLLEVMYAPAEGEPKNKLRSSTSSLSVLTQSRTLLAVAPKMANSILALKRVNWTLRILLHRPVLKLLCLDPSEFGEASSLYETLQDRLLLFLVDPDVRVRSDVSSSIASLFNIFPAHADIYQSLYDDYIKTLIDMPNHLEAVATAMRLLAILASCSPLVLDSVLFSIHSACTVHPVFRNYVPLILDHIATKLGYKSRISLLIPRLRFVISEWPQLSLFPSFLYHTPNNSEFCRQHATEILMGIFSPKFVKTDPDASSSSMRRAPPLAPLNMTQYEDLVRICCVMSTTQATLLQSVSSYLTALVTVLESSGIKDCQERAEEIEAFVSNAAPSSQKTPSKTKRKMPAAKSDSTSLRSLVPSARCSVIIHILTIFSDAQDITTPPNSQAIKDSTSKLIQLREAHLHNDHGPSSDVDASLFDVEVLVRSLSDLATMKANESSFGSMILGNHWSLLAQLLEAIDSQFFDTNNDAEQMRALWSLRALALSVRLTTNTAIPVFQSLFRFLHYAHQTQKKDLLLATLWSIGVISEDVSRNDGPVWQGNKEFIEAFTTFVFPLFDIVHRPASSTSSHTMKTPTKEEIAAIEIVEQAAMLFRSIFFADGNPCLSLREYGTLPNLHASFIEINETIDALQAATRPPEEDSANPSCDFLNAVIHLSATSSSPKIVSALEKFIEGVKKHRSAVDASLDSLSSGTASSSRTPFQPNMLAKAIWILVQLSSIEDHSVQRKVAEALGEMGSFPPQGSRLQSGFGLLSLDQRIPIDTEVSLDDTISQEDDHEVHSRASQNSSRSRTRGGPHYRAATEHILALMNKRQADASWEVSRTAKAILRRLLKLRSIRNLDLSANGILCWDEGDLSVTVVSLDEDLPATQSTSSADQWNPEGKEYDVWLSSLCARLCELSTEEELQCCRDMCSIDAHFSEMLLPVLLHNHLTENTAHNSDPSFEYFLESVAEAPFIVGAHKRAFRQLISTIVAIRTSVMWRLQQQLKTKTNVVLQPFAFVQPNTALYVAKIAKIVSMPCTALSFLELWCESTNRGELKWPDDHNAVTKSRSLALDIFADLDDSDGVNGIYQLDAALHDPMSLGTIYMQERNWTSMMNLFEVAKRPSGPPVPRNLHHNMLLALQYSGHHHILQHYVAGLVETAGGNVSEDLSEFQFQAAWRLSDWNYSFSSFASFASSSSLPSSASGGPSSGRADSNAASHLATRFGTPSRYNADTATHPASTATTTCSGMNTARTGADGSFPFHRMAFTCLRTALQTSPAMAPDVIDAARVALLQSELSFVSTETKKHIGPTVAKLKFFTEIQDAVEHMKSHPPKRTGQVAPSRASLLMTPPSSSAPPLSQVPSSSTQSTRANARSAAVASVSTPAAAGISSGIDSLNPDLLNILLRWSNSMQFMKSHSSERFEETVEPLVALRGLLLPSMVGSSAQLPELQASYWISVLHTSRKTASFQLAAVALEQARSSLRALSSLAAGAVTFPRLASASPSPNGRGSATTPVPMSAATSSAINSTASSHILAPNKTRNQRLQALSRRFALEECKFYWAQQRPKEAVALAKSQLRVLESSGSSVDLAKMLRLTGEWLGASKLESPSVVLDLYTRATDMLRDLRQDNADRCKAYFDLGKFTDDLYQQGLERKKTPEWQESMTLQSKISAEIGGIQDEKSRRTATTLYKEEMQAVGKLEFERELTQHLNRAVSMYLYALLKGDKHNTQAIFRLTSLWFSNATDPRLSATIKANIRKVPGYKFLPLFYQIASRISAQTSDFQESLQDLIVKIVSEHPQPAFYQLVALANGGKSGTHNTSPASFDKSRAALNLIGKVKTHIAPMVDGMLSISQGYVDLAMYNFPKNTPSPTRMPTASLIHYNTPGIPVCTATYNLRDAAKDMVHVVSFDKWVKFVGGINLPRLVRCLGSDGKYYPQLVKGKDDLRQDAVMQQLFHTINVILKADNETKKLGLNIRTYNVLPLSPLSGVLEWVDNTQPLGDYLLVGQNAAHVRHRPKDWTTAKCRQTMEAAAKVAQKALHQAYLEVQAKFKPVLHHFFLENFLDPATWYERRMAYTRSLATSSIVGHIVGLGDRHSQNILLDKLSGEVVHIDLGIAFDQGKALPIPELVPFRLTRDIVDGLGIIGVRGAFTRCCEQTVRILREKHENLVTIAEVFLHDPLSKWLVRAPAGDTSDNKQRQPRATTSHATRAKDDSYAQQATAEATALLFSVTDDAPRNTKASTTLIRFKQKLLGQEDGVALSVEGQVQHLITAAQDEDHLSAMFPGWAAWV